MIVIGTAGHIDHGKSAIVKRLTGTDPDRLPEEKKRGITIDLGFAFYRTPSGDNIAFVDVPGHERFVKNMIAGAGGIDVAMLVVAADDGWMPQSQEHFQVIRLLGIKSGLIVINKIDLADSDWLQLLKQDIRDKVHGSFLAEAPVLSVSAETGDGFDALRRHLDRLAEQTATARDIDRARLYIDRSFVSQGVGGVVTGTLRGGRLSVGRTVALWPAMTTGKIRSLQTNNREVSVALPGQRTAVAFTGVNREVLVRGGVVSDRLDLSFFREHPVLALSVEVISEAPVALVDRRRLLVIAGTSEMEGEIRLFDRKKIGPGETGVMFFKPDTPPYCLVGDHYIARLPTPMVTLGGGRVLDHLTHFPRRKQLDDYRYLLSRLDGDLRSLVVSELQKRVVATAADLLREADWSAVDVGAAVSSLVEEKVLGTSGRYVYHADTIETTGHRFTQRVQEFLEAKPHLVGLSFEELTRVSGLDEVTLRVLLDYLVATGRITVVADKYNLAGRSRELKGAVREAHRSIMSNLKKQPYSPPSLSTLASGGKNHKEAIKYIIEMGEAYKCGSAFLFLAQTWREIVAFIKESLNQSGKLAVADLRDRFGFTRKYAIPILEETDRIKLTRREGDIRVKGDKFADRNTAS